MKTAGLSFALLLSVSAVASRAADPAPTAPATPVITPAPEKISPDTAQRVDSALPKYTEPEVAKAAVDFTPVADAKPAVDTKLATDVRPVDATPVDSETVELPKVTVTHKKRPRLGDDVMMTSAAFNDKLAKDHLTSFDRDFLNKFTLPSWFGGQSAADRAREDYNREKKQQLINDVQAVSKALDQIDPAEAKSLRDAAAKP